jgi:exosortase A-associated hydrolase 2
VAESFFFGTKPQNLFGVYHAPETHADRDLGVVIAPPYGSEYMKTHRALRQLALRLARSGFHVLRFDFRGCGDSAGEPDDACLDVWVEDLDTAIDELKDRTGVGRVALAGLRLGGTLALLAAARRRDVEALALWEPILDGPAYVAELTDLGRTWRRQKRIETGRAADDEAADILGFPLANSLRQSLSDLSLELRRRPARRVLLLLESEPPPSASRLLESLRGFGARPEERRVTQAQIWRHDDGADRALIPQSTLKCVVSWLAGDDA